MRVCEHRLQPIILDMCVKYWDIIKAIDKMVQYTHRLTLIAFRA